MYSVLTATGRWRFGGGGGGRGAQDHLLLSSIKQTRMCTRLQCLVILEVLRHKVLLMNGGGVH